MIAAVMGLWALVLIAIAIRWPQYLVHSAIVCSVFQGAAIIYAGGIGISPYYFTLMLIAGHCLFLRTDKVNFFGHTGGVRRIMSCASVLLIVGLGSAVVLPWVFRGLPVMSPRLSEDTKSPLQFSTSNIGQCVYLLLNFLALWYAAQTCRTPVAVRGLLKAFVIAGVTVVGFGGYQLLSSLTGLPFPDDLLYSNGAYIMQSGSTILDMPRICSTYTEPAGVASFLIPFVLYLVCTFESSNAKRRDITLLLCSIACCMLSTSSTAYLGLMGVGGYATWRYIFLPVLKGRGSGKAAVAVTVMILAIVCTVVVNESLRDVFQKMVLEKSDSSSYEDRSGANTYSMEIAERSWGLGVGLGSNRGSAFLPSMLSQVGICGVVTIAVLIILFLRSPVTTNTELRSWHLPLAAAQVGACGVQAIAGPDLSSPSIWVIMIIMVSLSTTAEFVTADETFSFDCQAGKEPFQTPTIFTSKFGTSG